MSYNIILYTVVVRYIILYIAGGKVLDSVSKKFGFSPRLAGVMQYSRKRRGVDVAIIKI